MIDNDDILLSICIASMNRGSELRKQVEDLLSSCDDRRVEVVVADASPSDKQLSIEDPRLQVVALSAPGGVDFDYDQAISRARGQYCWLFTDDDKFADNTVQRILESITNPVSSGQLAPSLILVNACVQDPSGNLLESSMLKPNSAALPAGAAAASFASLSYLLTFIGAVVVDRQLWVERRSDAYVGSEFRHVGLILSKPLPGPVEIISDPLITIKYGVSHWEPRALRVWTKQWPELIQSVLPDPLDWNKFYPRSLARQSFALLKFRARRLLSSANVHEAFPTDAAPSRRFVFYVLAHTPVPVARLIAAVTTKVLLPNDRHFEFDVARSRERDLLAKRK
jgi:glycosyltransferase involved in cell wall biosynthesis